MATSQTAQVGLPFRDSGLAQLVIGILIGAVAAALIVSLIGSDGGAVAVRARGVDTYSLGKALNAETIGGTSVAAHASDTADLFDYSRGKVEEQKGEPEPVFSDEPSVRNLTE